MKPKIRPMPGDLAAIVARFKDGQPRHALVLNDSIPASFPGYYVLLDGEKKFFPAHLVKVVQRG